MILNDINVLSQSIFRNLIESIACPGKIINLSLKNLNIISEYERCLFGICRTLFDHETTFCLIGNKTNEAIIEEVFKLTKARYTTIEDAEYIIVYGGSDGMSLLTANPGNLLYPDKGATILYKVSSLTDNKGINLMLEGPGIEDKIELSINGVLKTDIEIIKQINTEFPLGLDTIFIDDDDNITSIPRSSKITIKG